METFGDIAARTGLNRDTIRNRHRRLIAAGESVGIQRDGVWLFDKENAAKIDGPLVDNKKQPITPEVQVTDTSQTSAIDLNVADSVDMKAFRSDREIIFLDDEGSAAIAYLSEVLDKVEGQFGRIEKDLENKFQQAKTARIQAERRINQTRQRISEHRVKTDILSMMTNNEVDRIEGIVDEFNELVSPGE